MDSVAEDDITLPLDFDRSTNIAKFKAAVAAGTGEDMLDSSAELSEGLKGRPLITAGASQDSAGSPQTKTMKDYEYQISELKKENFGLKLRIYFLEQQNNSDIPEDIFKANIELKVTVEKLKKELVERQELLVKASNAVEALAQHSDAQIKQLTEEHNEELREIREGYEIKLKDMEKELTIARHDLDDIVEKLADMANINQQLNEKLAESTDGFHEDQQQIQVAMKATLNEKDRMIDDLRASLLSTEAENMVLKDSLAKLKERLETQGQNIAQSDELEINGRKIRECEQRIKQLTQELENRQTKLEDFKEKAKKMERSNRDLRNQLHDKEIEQQLHSRNSMDASQSQRDVSITRDSEMENLQTKVQDLNQSLTATREAAHAAKRNWYQAFEEHAEVLKARDAMIAALQSSVSAKDMELEKLIQSMSAKEVELHRLNNGKGLLEQRLDAVLKQKELEQAELLEKHKTLSQDHYSKMDALEEAYQRVSVEAQEQLEAKDRIIQKLAVNNNEKDNLIADILRALEEDSGLKSPSSAEESLVNKLSNCLKEKDRALQVAAEEKLRALQGKEGELQQLRQSLRERDRLIEKINAAVLESEGKNKILETASREKCDTLQKTSASLEDQLKGRKEDLKNKEVSLREKEVVIQKLKNNLNSREGELKELKDFVKNALSSEAEDDGISEEARKSQEMSDLLKEKEKLLEDLFRERSKMSSAHEANSQRLMSALRDKEAALKEAANDMTRIQTEKNASIQRLQQLLNSKEHEVQALENSKAWASQENDKLMNKLKMSLREKDRTIEGLVESGKEKDKLLKALQESAKSPSKSISLAEAAELKRNIGLLQADVQKKDESLKQLESDYRNNLRKLQGDDRENKLKFEDLRHQIEAKDAHLKQVQASNENLRLRLQSMPKLEELKQKFAEQSQALADAQKSKEQALVDLAALKKLNLELEAELKVQQNDVEMLNEAAQMKDNIIKEMQEDQQKQLTDMKENIGYYQKKAQELEGSNNLLNQQLVETEDLKNSLEQQLENCKRRLSNQTSQTEDEVNSLRQEVANLKAKLQMAGSPRRESYGVGTGAEDQRPSVLQLQQLLEAQINETRRLNDILAAEHALYDAQYDGEMRYGSKVADELQALRSLRAQLEEGIRENDRLRAELHKSVTCANSTSQPVASPYDAAYQREIQELKTRLEESERWNASLQARLNEWQSRDSSDGAWRSPSKVQRLEQQVEKLKEQLKQSSQLNIRLRNQLDEVNSLNIQTLTDKDIIIKDLRQKVETLQAKLDNTTQSFGELERRLTEANEKLDFYSSRLSGIHDETLLEREQELELLKREMRELRHVQVNNTRISSDREAQTSPSKDWVQVTSGTFRELERKYEESRQMNEKYDNILREREIELQLMKQQGPPKAEQNFDKLSEVAEIQKLRMEYEAGIKTNEELKRLLESEREKTHGRSKLSDETLELRLQLDESSQQNDELRRRLNESVGSEQEISRLRLELQNATQVNDSLGSQIRELNESFSKLKGVRMEAIKLRKELQDAKRLNKTLTNQLKETRKSAEEIGRVRRELREAKMMNEQLGKQLAELLDHSAKMKNEVEKSQLELQEKDEVIKTLELDLQSKPEMHSVALSPFSSPSPPKRYGQTQTSPSGHENSLVKQSITALPEKESAADSMEKLHQMNRMLLGENQLLRSKLKDSDKLNDTLRNENRMMSKLHNQSTQAQATSDKQPSTEDLMAAFLAEMRELRLRLEDSIRTNDALRAQLEKRLLTDGGGEGSSLIETDKIILIRENDSLRSELLEKDRINQKLKKAIDGLKQEQARDKDQVNLLRQQLVESTKVSENLRKELTVYEKLYKLTIEGRSIEVQTEGQSYGREGPRSPNSDPQQDALSLLLAEIRSLRIQLEKSIQTNNALRLKLEEQLGRPPDSPSQSPSRSHTTVIRELNFSKGKGVDDDESVGSAKALENGSTSSEDGRVVDQLEEKLNAINKFATDMYNSIISSSQTDSLAPVENILRIVLECKELLNELKVNPPSRIASANCEKDVESESLKLEIAKLKRRLLIQEDIIKKACERLEGTNKVKENMRAEVIDKLSRSHQVLRGARERLEDRVHTRKGNK